MKVLLIKDVYKLGHAGEVKKVANGFGRNYLIPQGLAILATPGALKQAERIREEASERRALLNQEMSGVAERLQDVTLNFPAKAGETDKLYGSITTRMIADGLTEATQVEISPKQVDSQPIRILGIHSVDIRLTMDLVPQIKVIVYREGESPESVLLAAEEAAAEEAAAAAEAEEEAVIEAVAEDQAAEAEVQEVEESVLEKAVAEEPEVDFEAEAAAGEEAEPEEAISTGVEPEDEGKV